MQYYHIAKVVITISTPRAAISGYERLREGRKLEVLSPEFRRFSRVLTFPVKQKTVRNHLLVILGLAVSNKRVENTLFTARHALSVCGFSIS